MTDYIERQDIIRVLRVIEYSGPRDLVEKQVRDSIHGEKRGLTDRSNGNRFCTIKAATIGTFPEILQPAPTPPQEVDHDPN